MIMGWYSDILSMSYKMNRPSVQVQLDSCQVKHQTQELQTCDKLKMKLCLFLHLMMLMLILCQGQLSYSGLSYDDLSTWLQGFNWMKLGREVCQCHLYHHQKYCQWTHKDQQLQCLGQCKQQITQFWIFSC